MIHAFRLLAGTFALATSVFVAEASGAELKVLSAGAMRAALQELAPAFEAASGNTLKIEYSTAGDIEKKVAAGDEIDVAILTKPRVDKLASEAKIVGGSSQTLARAQIGLAVKRVPQSPTSALSKRSRKRSSMPNRSRMPIRRAAPPAGSTWRIPSRSWASLPSPNLRRGSLRQAGVWPCTPPRRSGPFPDIRLGAQRVEGPGGTCVKTQELWDVSYPLLRGGWPSVVLFFTPSPPKERRPSTCNAA